MGESEKNIFLLMFSMVDDLFLLLLCHHESLEVLGVDLAALDPELGEGVVHLLLRELVAPGHQGVSEPARDENDVLTSSNIGIQFKTQLANRT